MAHDVNQGETDVAAQVRSALVSKISEERLDLWMPESTRWQVVENRLTLSFDSESRSQFAQRMLKQELLEAFRETLRGLGTQSESVSNCELVFEVVARESLVTKDELELSDRKIESFPTLTQTSADGRAQPIAIGPQTQVQASQATEPDLWSTYVPGDSNQLAVAAAKLVIVEPGSLSPVFVHGPTGAGKSLLVSAIAQQLRVVRRLPRVIHMTSEQFLNDFTEGLRGGGLPMFRKKYRDVEALIVEDIQFFLGKKSSIVEIKNTVDNLLRLKKQVVFTADRSLNDLQGLGAELVGRIRGGLTAPIFPLDAGTREKVLRNELTGSALSLPDDVVQQLASRVTGDGRVLSGIVKRLKAVSTFHSHREKGLDWTTCWDSVSDLVQTTQPIVRIKDIERVVCDVFGLDSNSLQSTSKMRRVSQPRMLAMFLARKYTPAAYKEIGSYFGSRRHSTVISAEKTVTSWLDENAELDLGNGISVREAIRHVESQLQVG